ncbi:MULTISPECIES: threonine ammonia-lyase [unclassified Jeotgalibaca]|uniref:threonine ammonia-lyase n=1 Tax=unclassified Jeotgalibaca TaxID=2621505 RepID=UPI003FD3358B
MEEKLTLEMVQDAWKYLKKEYVTHRTPMVTSTMTDDRVDRHVYFKMENQQKTGSFKLRGASYKVHSLTTEELKRGVVSSSAGNHAQGVAMAAYRLGERATIFMPKTTPEAKINAATGYGAKVILVGDSYEEAGDAAQKYHEENNVTYVHPYDDFYVMAGQGTIALEMLEQEPDLDMIICPIGGGGLISGVALTAKKMKPSIKIIGVEAAQAASMHHAFKTGEIKRLETANTIAEGIAVKEPGKNTYAVVKQYVDDIVTVTEEEIADAVLWMLERNKTLVEGAGAASLAALLAHNDSLPKADKIGLIVSGGNIDLSAMPMIQSVARGLNKAVEVKSRQY